MLSFHHNTSEGNALMPFLLNLVLAQILAKKYDSYDNANYNHMDKSRNLKILHLK